MNGFRFCVFFSNMSPLLSLPSLLAPIRSTLAYATESLALHVALGASRIFWDPHRGLEHVCMYVCMPWGVLQCTAYCVARHLSVTNHFAAAATPLFSCWEIFYASVHSTA